MIKLPNWLTKWLRLLRVKQWVKNGFVATPLIFSRELTSVSQVEQTALAVLAFCLAASAVYIINDITDLERDKVHPQKKFRPLASGQISLTLAYAVALVLGLFAFGIGFIVGRGFVLVLLGYIGLVSLYSYQLKKIVILDIFLIAFGFVLRAVGGAVAIGVLVSNWLLVTAFFLALILGFGKRRHELVLLGEEAGKHRQNLSDYSRAFLDQLVTISAASALLAYAVYTLSAETVTHFGSQSLVFTLPWVVYGVFRYLLLVYIKDGGGDPTHTLYTDKHLLVAGIGWVVTVVAIIYG